MLKRVLVIVAVMVFIFQGASASYIMIPMDLKQKEHLKAYGITYWVLEKGVEAWWLLNYRGGSFAFQHSTTLEKECLTRGISFEIITEGGFTQIRTEIADPEANMEAVKLEKAPKIAVYTPDFNVRGEKIQPWDDAVTLALAYAEIPYEAIYDEEVVTDRLAEFDWLHLHHEDFTGQYGKFYSSNHSQPWYKENQRRQEALAKRLGFSKVSELKREVVHKIREYVAGGGFMFAMCSATDSYDIALAIGNTDICAEVYDGDPFDPAANEKLDYTQTFAFKDFKLILNPFEYEFSTIDQTPSRRQIAMENDYFTLFDFSAKWDAVPTMLTQNHTRTVKGFMGQTTAFNKNMLKTHVLVLGETKPINEVRYIHGEFGQGTWTFYGGHDPEDYRHQVGDPETDLSLHPNSPGYRLILNNILFPAAKKKERKT